jgi:hypothetical protein
MRAVLGETASRGDKILAKLSADSTDNRGLNAFDRAVPAALPATLRSWCKKICDFSDLLFKIICGIGYSIF